MKLRSHLALVFVGALLFAGISFIVGNAMPAFPRWYHYPFIFPVYVASKFGSGGEDLNATAGNLAGVLECIAFGVMADGVIVLCRRFFSSRRSTERIKFKQL